MKKLFAILCLVVLLFSIVQADHRGRARRRHRIRTVITGSPIRLLDPTDIPDLLSRVFDAVNNSFTDLAKTTNPLNTELVRVWEDIDTALGEDLTSPADANRPEFRTLGNLLRWDNSNDVIRAQNTTFLDFNSTDDFCIYVVPSHDVVTGGEMVMSKATAGPTRGWHIFRLGAALQFSLINTPASNQIRTTATFTVIAGSPYEVIVCYDGSETGAGVSWRIDGVDRAQTINVNNLSATTQSSAFYQLGNRNTNNPGAETLGGNLREVNVWERDLTSGEKDIIDAYHDRTY